MPRLVRGALLLAWGSFVACAPAEPSEAPPTPVSGPGLACMALPIRECQPFAAALIDLLGPEGAAITHLEVGPVECRAEPCPRSMQIGAPVMVVAQFVDGRQPAWLRLDPGSMAIIERGDVDAGPIPASSARAGPGPQPLDLGHCGLASGIDFDGSWWDPIGEVDALDSAAINSASGTIALSGPDRAVFETPRGFRVEFVRHAGAKWLAGCA